MTLGQIQDYFSKIEMLEILTVFPLISTAPLGIHNEISTSIKPILWFSDILFSLVSTFEKNKIT